MPFGSRLYSLVGLKIYKEKDGVHGCKVAPFLVTIYIVYLTETTLLSVLLGLSGYP